MEILTPKGSEKVGAQEAMEKAISLEEKRAAMLKQIDMETDEL